MGRSTRPRAAPTRRPDRASRLRTHRARTCARRHPRHRRLRPLSRQRATASSGATHLCHRVRPTPDGSTERAGQPRRAAVPDPDRATAEPDAVQRLVRKHATAPQPSTVRLFGPSRLHPHVLRHSCAMTLLQAGVDTAVIALWLGHADIRSTNAYLHADMTIKQTALDRTTPAVQHTRPLPAFRPAARLPRSPVTMPTRSAAARSRSPPLSQLPSGGLDSVGIVPGSA